MSNSIWKTPTVRPVKDCIVVWQNPAHMSFTLPRTAHKYMEKYNCERWSTLDDLIAQADKAERLQKAVDLAVDVLKEAETTRELTCHGHYVHAISIDELHSALTEIKQLIKEQK